MKELLADVRRLYEAVGGKAADVHPHYLEMPAVLRVRGGMGTHWMLPSVVRLGEPDKPDPDETEIISVDALLVRDIIRHLFQPNGANEPLRCEGDAEIEDDELLESVRERIGKEHGKRWSDLEESLGGN